MKILGISGSASTKSSNFYLLQAITNLWKRQHDIEVIDGLEGLKMFSPKALEQGLPSSIKKIKNKVLEADLVLISTPEYSHNIPSCLKSLLEWCTASGEFYKKNVIPITFTPHQPRGKYAMKSLLMSLQSLQANLLFHLSLYKTEVEITHQNVILNNDIEAMFQEVMKSIEIDLK